MGRGRNGPQRAGSSSNERNPTGLLGMGRKREIAASAWLPGDLLFPRMLPVKFLAGGVCATGKLKVADRREGGCRARLPLAGRTSRMGSRSQVRPRSSLFVCCIRSGCRRTSAPRSPFSLPCNQTHSRRTSTCSGLGILTFYMCGHHRSPGSD